MADGSITEEAAKGWYSEGKCELGAKRYECVTNCEPCCHREKSQQNKNTD